jgi:carbonic anhydrase/acetyltransferase-like protein (isoleucine patch superfamily)
LEKSSVWFNAVIRGDVNTSIGNKVNIQDGAVIHCTYKKTPNNDILVLATTDRTDVQFMIMCQ